MRNLGRYALLIAATALTAPAIAAAGAPQSVPVSALVKQVSIPHTIYKLRNGLTVIVHGLATRRESVKLLTSGAPDFEPWIRQGRLLLANAIGALAIF